MSGTLSRNSLGSLHRAKKAEGLEYETICISIWTSRAGIRRVGSEGLEYGLGIESAHGAYQTEGIVFPFSRSPRSSLGKRSASRYAQSSGDLRSMAVFIGPVLLASEETLCLQHFSLSKVHRDFYVE